jgi:hypothetical protein
MKRLNRTAQVFTFGFLRDKALDLKGHPRWCSLLVVLAEYVTQMHSSRRDRRIVARQGTVWNDVEKQSVP